MPIYAYRCTECGHAKDVLQKMSDPVLSLCPACGAAAFSKQVTAAGFQLKGSGWYVTDFRGGANGAAKDAKPAADGTAGEAKPVKTANPASDSGVSKAVDKAVDKASDKAADKSTAKPAAAAPAAGSSST